MKSSLQVLALAAFAVGAGVAGFLGGLGLGSWISPPREHTSVPIADGSPVERGSLVYQRSNCASCHGELGAGGVANPNAATGEEVPALKYVKEAYTADELKGLIRVGVVTVVPLDPAGAKPPLSMPPWDGILSNRELDDLVAFLFSLYPEDEALDW